MSKGPGHLESNYEHEKCTKKSFFVMFVKHLATVIINNPVQPLSVKEQ